MENPYSPQNECVVLLALENLKKHARANNLCHKQM